MEGSERRERAWRVRIVDEDDEVEGTIPIREEEMEVEEEEGRVERRDWGCN